MKENLGFWKRLSIIGTQDFPTESLEKEIACRVNRLTIYVALINLFIGVPTYFFLINNVWLLIGVLSEITMCLLPLYLNYRKFPKEASQALYLVICAASFYFCCLLRPVAQIETMTVVLCLCSRFIFINRWLQFANCLIAVLVDIAVHLNTEFSWIPRLNLDNNTATSMYYIIYAVVALLLISTAYWGGQIRQILRSKQKSRAMPVNSSSNT